MNILKQSPAQSFRLTQIVESLVICEAVGGDQLRWQASPDRFNGGNGTDSQLAFLLALGSREEEISGGVL